MSFKEKFSKVILNLKNKSKDIRVVGENGHYKLVAYTDEFENDIQSENTNDDIEPFNLLDCLFERSFDYLMDYIDNNGNTFYHELVLQSNKKLIKKLVDNDEFESFVLNNDNKIPIELTTDIEIISMLITSIKYKCKTLLKQNEIYIYDDDDSDVSDDEEDDSELDFLNMKPSKLTFLLTIFTSLLLYFYFY